uniref:Small ribosomal subunit protein bS16c n=1 Tax=Cliftonaea pectinata TaxID=2007206 RepID=A0A1Z1MQ12_9FLOR|nr:ribosomal protein S16 [Cliftonaea pectinata]ARW68148.1 ribosomal protein S16 [Cliftonaea pectinata]
MLKIRLKRLGRKKKACYRIIVVDSRRKRDGKALEEIGFYNPLNKQRKVDIEKLKVRIKQGAKTTKTVENIIKNN